MNSILFENIDKISVGNLKNGDEQAFINLFEKYSRKIYAVSRKLNLSHEDAEGVVQEVFLEIWRNRTSLNENLSFNAYILTIAKSLIIKLARKKACHLAYENYALYNSLAYNNQTEDYVIFSEMEAFSKECLDLLPMQQRQIFMMRTQENFSMEDISLELKISKRTVENHFYRACKLMKEKLSSRQIISVVKIITPILYSFIFFI